VLTFWVAYILTRPIGASFADFFGMPKDISGMGVGHGAVSIVTLILVVASIAYLSRSGIDQPEAASPAGAAAPGYNQPSYGQAQYYGDPRYAEPRQGDPRYGADPGYRNPQYGDQRDYRY
jgi:hypothetical protein